MIAPTSVAFAEKNLTTEVVLNTITAPATGTMRIVVQFDDLNGAAATLKVRAVIDAGGTPRECGPARTMTKAAAATTMVSMPPIFADVEEDDVVTVYGFSTNASDSSEGGNLLWWDAHAANAEQIAGSADAAVNLAAQNTRPTIYVDHDGDDETSGVALKAAVEGASAGTLLKAGAGEFALGDNTIRVPDGVDFEGIGIGITTVTSSAALGEDGCIVSGGEGSTVRRMTIRGILSSTFQSPIGAYESAGQSVPMFCVYEDIEGYAYADGLFVESADVTGTMLLRRVRLHSEYDTISMQIEAGRFVVSAYDCEFIVRGNTSGVARGATLRLGALGLIARHCVFDVTRAGGTATETYGVQTDDVDAFADLFDCTIHTSAPAGVVYDLTNDAGTIRESNVRYDRTKVSGAITSLLQATDITHTAGSAIQQTGGRLHVLDGSGAALATSAQAAVIAEKVAGLNGEAMRGTDGANTTAPDNAGIEVAALAAASADGKLTAGRLAKIDGAMQSDDYTAPPTASEVAGAVRDVDNTNPAADSLGADVNAIKAKTNTIGSISVTYSGPVASSGDVTVVSGDDYNVADGRELSWTSTGWPDLTGATVVFTVERVSDNTDVIDKSACTIVTPTGTAQVYANLTAAQTGALAPTTASVSYRYDVQATLASGRIVTLTRGNVVVLADYSD